MEVWLSAKQRLFVKSELRLPKGEKSKPRKKMVKNLFSSTRTREVLTVSSSQLIMFQKTRQMNLSRL